MTTWTGHRRRRFADVLPDGIDAVARGGIAESQARLPAPLRRLHRQILQHTLASGQPPCAADIGHFTGELELEEDDALRALAEADLVHLGTDGGVAVAYPLSGRASPHRVELDSGIVLHAMCAVDALGIPLMARQPATITSQDSVDERHITVRFDGERWHWQPPGTVVLLAADACTGSIANACVHTQFHATAPNAQAYRQAHPHLLGQVLNKIEATEIAGSEFDSLLYDSTTT
ncbi:organomercurial lyase [Amycolatopsis sp. NPDC004747]